MDKGGDLGKKGFGAVYLMNRSSAADGCHKLKGQTDLIIEKVM